MTNSWAVDEYTLLRAEEIMDGIEAFEMGRDAFDQGYGRKEFAAYDIPAELADDFAKGWEYAETEREEWDAIRDWREANPGSYMWKPWDGRA